MNIKKESSKESEMSPVLPEKMFDETGEGVPLISI
jgi:hypothetical protein